MGNSSKRIPLYQQIREYIMDQIQQNLWKPNDRLPSENELTAQFNVSRITIKKALKELTEDGTIYRIQGKGSFISSDSGETILYRSKQNLSSKKLVAFLMPRLDNLFTANLMKGIELELSRRGYHLIFHATHESTEIEKQVLNEMTQIGVEGIIIYPVEGESYSEEILRLTLNEFPLVVVDRYLPGVETNCVCSDNIGGALEATSHLINLGHTRIGFVSTFCGETTSTADRLFGYEKALAEAGILIDHRLRLGVVQHEAHLHAEPAKPLSIKEEIHQFLKRNPDMSAIFAVNTTIGITIMEAAHELGIRIPEELSLVFFDDFEFSPSSRIPPTVINQQEKDIGCEAAKLLISIIENPKQERRKLVLPTQLIVRQTTATFRNKDKLLNVL